MALLDLAKYLEDDGLDIVVPSTKHPEGKSYHVASPDADTGLWLTRMAAVAGRAVNGTLTEEQAAQVQLDDEEEAVLYQRVLGGTYQELVDDSVSWVRLQRLGMYLFLYFAVSPEVAEASISGEAQAAPNRAARRAKKSTSTASRATSKRAPKEASVS